MLLYKSRFRTSIKNLFFVEKGNSQREMRFTNAYGEACQWTAW